MVTKKTTTRKKAAPKKSTAKVRARVASVEAHVEVKHAPEAGPQPNRQAKGWRNSQPVYED